MAKQNLQTYKNCINLAYSMYLVLILTQMKGKREFPSDVPASGDVLSHLSESEMLLFLLLYNTGEFC